MAKKDGFHAAAFDDQDLIEALQEAKAPDDDGSDPGSSAEELYEQMRIGRAALMKRLHEGVRSGSIVVGKRSARNLVGVWRMIPVYRFVEKSKARKAKK